MSNQHQASTLRLTQSLQIETLANYEITIIWVTIAFSQKIGVRATLKVKKQIAEVSQFNLKIKNVVSSATLKRKKNIVAGEPEWGRTAIDEEKKIFQNSTHRLIEIKLTLASHKRRAFLRIPYRTRKKTFFLHFEFTQTFPLSRFSMTRNKFAGNF